MQLTVLDYFTPTKKLLELGFTKDEILTAINKSGNTVQSLTDETPFPSEPTYFKTYEVVKDRHRYKAKEYNGNWEREVEKTGVLCRVPARYQGLRHGEILRHLFTEKWPWFADFKTTVKRKAKSKIRSIEDVPEEMRDLPVSKILEMMQQGEEVAEEKPLWDLYEFHGYEKQDYEMYLKTEFGSLYVPLQALLKSDFSIIEKRMQEYCGWYYNESGYGLNHRGRTFEQYKADREEEKRKALLPLVSKEAEALKKFLSR